jgi:hypothetical protein
MNLSDDHTSDETTLMIPTPTNRKEKHNELV